MRIFDYLDSRLVAFLDVETRNQAIEKLISLLDEGGHLPNQEAFRRAIFYREDLVSTGIGLGIAIPHAKLKELSKFFIAVGIQKGKGIDWNALDRAPVRLIFMIGGPEDRQTEYLQILSLLTSVIREIDIRKKLLNAHSKEEVLDLFSQF